MSGLDPALFPPKPARMHEACGPGAAAFAAVLAAQLDGPVLWVLESWRADMLTPQGLSAFFDPARLLIARAKDQTEVLAVTEEALRGKTLSLVVAELARPIGLTPGRRLQLAAGEGRTLGLCLIADGAGSNAAETRWHCAPVFDADPGIGDSTPMRWEIIKNKSGTLGAWHVRWEHATRRLHVVSPAGERPGSQGAAG
ncbi:MAG: protein ImuA [Rhodobacteraceae bacterium HLUCCA08]|nr:MAG: protein ImuA [Rhodobacteraceae bacterium HLUCCA08]